MPSALHVVSDIEEDVRSAFREVHAFMLVAVDMLVHLAVRTYCILHLQLPKAQDVPQRFREWPVGSPPQP
jgi:hypothetical protein